MLELRAAGTTEAKIYARRIRATDKKKYYIYKASPLAIQQRTSEKLVPFEPSVVFDNFCLGRSTFSCELNTPTHAQRKRGKGCERDEP